MGRSWHDFVAEYGENVGNDKYPKNSIDWAILKRKVEKHFKEGLSFPSLAGVLRISSSCLYAWRDKHEEFRDILCETYGLTLLFHDEVHRDGATGKNPYANATLLNRRAASILGMHNKQYIEQESTITQIGGASVNLQINGIDIKSEPSDDDLTIDE